MAIARNRSIKKNVSLLFSSCLAGLLLFELVLWLSGYNRPLLYAYDRHTGSALRANVAGWAETESSQFVRIDEHGFRIHDNPHLGPKITKKKPPGVFRIAVLGDSYTESHHVAYVDSFPYLMERRLNTCKAIGKRVEVLNFAVSGYNNVQELQSFRYRAKAFDPDLVLLVFHANNDLSGNYRNLEKTRFIPYAEFRSGELVLDLTFQEDEAFRDKLDWSNRRNEIINKMRLLQLAANAYVAWVNWRARTSTQGNWREADQAARDRAPANAGEKSDASPSLSELTAADFDKFFADGYRPPKNGGPGEHFPPRSIFHEALWRLAEAVILRIRDEVTNSGAAFWLTATATGIAISPDENKRAEFLEAERLETTDYAGDRLAAFAKRKKFPFISLASTLRSAAQRGTIDFERFGENSDVPGHWNAEGHSMVAKKLADSICR